MKAKKNDFFLDKILIFFKSQILSLRKLLNSLFIKVKLEYFL